MRLQKSIVVDGFQGLPTLAVMARIVGTTPIISLLVINCFVNRFLITSSTRSLLYIPERIYLR